MKCLHTLLLLFVFCISSFASILPENRKIDWRPGIQGAIPVKTDTLNVLDFGASGNGTDNDANAFIDAIRTFSQDGGVLKIPAGDYLIKQSLETDKPIIYQGEGHQHTRLLFDLEEAGDNCIDFSKYVRGSFYEILEGFHKGSTKLFLNDVLFFVPGQFIEIRQENDPDLMYTQSKWIQGWAEDAVGQIIQIQDIAGDTLILARPLYFDYSEELIPVVRTLGMILYPGVKDLYIERIDAGDGHTIQMKYTAYGQIERVESNMSYRSHIMITNSVGCEVRNCYLHHAHDYGGGGHGYGVDVISQSTDNLIINTVFEHLRHSMMTHVGSSGNVFAYNYSASRDPQNLCDISLHGHYANHNLFESNVVEEIDVSDYWGPIGPHNTFLRNQISQEGIEISDYSHGQNLLGNHLLKGSIQVKSSVENTLLHGNQIRTTVTWNDSIESHDLPASCFLQQKPDFFQDLPFPLFGPEIEETYQLPAQIRFNDGQPVTGIGSDPIFSPKSFEMQSYPNPFNPETTISFTLHTADRIRLALYDIRGREVALLKDDYFPSGCHSLTFIPSADLGSGLYLLAARGTAGVKTIKLTYLK